MEIKKKILLWGAGLHFHLMKLIIDEQNLGEVVLIYDHATKLPEKDLCAPLIKNINSLQDCSQQFTHYIVCIGNEFGRDRLKIASLLDSMGKLPLSCIDSSSYIHPTAFIEEGIQVFHSAIARPFSSIGAHTILNTRSLLEHDSRVGSGCHLMPGSIVNGACNIGDGVTLGSNSVILPKLSICDDVTVGAGAVVTRSIHTPGTYVGIPARRRWKERQEEGKKYCMLSMPVL